MEKRSILFVTLKVLQSQIQCKQLEKLDATGKDDMFVDDDINFNLQLDKFGEDLLALKDVPVERIFRAWVEDWDHEARKKNDPVAEAKLIAKYKGLVFCDPDTGNAFTVWHKYLEFRSGKGGGWFVIGECADDPNEILLEPFTLGLACELIWEAEQKNGI
jgi:hypothetical protein